MRSGLDWQRQAEPCLQRMLAALEARLMPGLRDSIVTRTSMMPLEFRDSLRSVNDSACRPEPVAP